MTLANETLARVPGETAAPPDAVATLTRPALVGLIVGRTDVDGAVASGALQVEGDVAAVRAIFAMLDDFDMQFDVVAPGPAPNT